MLKKLVVGTILAGALLRCGKYADLESKLAGPGSADPASVLQGTWRTDCVAFNGWHYKRESIYQGRRFQLRETYYSDSKCENIHPGYDSVSYGTFKILGASKKVEGAMEADFAF